MKLWLCSIAMLAAAAIPLAPALAQNLSANPKPEIAAAASDARALASDAEVGVARRAYRAQCGRNQPAAYCECMTGAMAQALAPNDLRAAASMFAGRHPRPAQMSRISAAAAQFAPTCEGLRS